MVVFFFFFFDVTCIHCEFAGKLACVLAARGAAEQDQGG